MNTTLILFLQSFEGGWVGGVGVHKSLNRTEPIKDSPPVHQSTKPSSFYGNLLPFLQWQLYFSPKIVPLSPSLLSPHISNPILMVTPAPPPVILPCSPTIHPCLCIASRHFVSPLASLSHPLRVVCVAPCP